MTLKCSTVALMTLSGVRSSWLASAANSRWRRQRLADRNERAGRVRPSADDCRGQGEEAADDEDDEQRIERALLGADVLRDLDHEGAVGPLHATL